MDTCTFDVIRFNIVLGQKKNLVHYVSKLLVV